MHGWKLETGNNKMKTSIINVEILIFHFHLYMTSFEQFNQFNSQNHKKTQIIQNNFQ